MSLECFVSTFSFSKNSQNMKKNFPLVINHLATWSMHSATFHETLRGRMHDNPDGVDIKTREIFVNSPRTDIIRHTIVIVKFIELDWNLKNISCRPWKSSRWLPLSSGFSVTVCIAALSERLLLEGGARSHLHATLVPAVCRSLLQDERCWRRDQLNR